MTRPVAALLVLAALAGLMPVGVAPAALAPSARLSDIAAADTVNLAPRFKAGETARVAMTLIVSSTMPGMMGMPDLTTTDEHRVWLTEKVIEASDKGAKVEFTYDRVAIKANTMMGPIDYDTQTGAKAPAANPYGIPQGDGNGAAEKHYKALIGEKVTVNFDAQGQIKSVDGDGDEGIPMMIGAACGLKAEPESFAVLFGPIAYWSKEQGADMNVAVGGGWTHKQAMAVAAGTNATLVTRHRVSGLDSGKATIDIEAGLDKPEKPDAYSMMKVTRSDGHGQMSFDAARGRLNAMRADLRYTVSAGEGMSTKYQITMTVDRE